MKYITLIIGLLVVGCGKDEKGEQAINDTVAEYMAQSIKLLEEEKLKKAKEATPKAKPTKGLTKEDFVGTYEGKIGENSVRMVYLENGICEWYANGKKEGAEAKWKIVEGQMHIIDGSGNVDVVRINKDDSITRIAAILKDGKRIDIPKEEQLAFKKIK